MTTLKQSSEHMYIILCRSISHVQMPGAASCFASVNVFCNPERFPHPEYRAESFAKNCGKKFSELIPML